MCQYIQRSPAICMPARGRGVTPRAAPGACRAPPGGSLLGDAAFDGADLVGALDAVADLAARPPRSGAACRRRLVRLAGGIEALAGVLADRLEHAEPAAAVRLHERLVDERLELVEQRSARLCADGLDVGDVHPPAKTARRRNSRCSDSVSSEWLQSIVARRVCCRVGSVARTGREHVERVVEPLEQRLRGEQPQPGGSELEREGKPSRRRQIACDRLGVLRRQREACFGPRSRARRTAPTAGGEARAGRAETPARRRSAAASGW